MDAKQEVLNLARKANGIGIVCGLEILVGPHCTVTVTEGFGITSKGMILHYPHVHFKYYLPYHKALNGLVRPEDDLEVWELIPERVQNALPMTPQTSGAKRFIDHKVILIYQQEDEIKETQKVLAIDKADLWKLLQRIYKIDLKCLPLDGVEPDNVNLFDYGEEDFPSGTALFCAANRNTSLSPIPMMRFGFATDEKECTPEGREFRIETADFAGIFSEYDLIITDALERLQKGIKMLHAEKFHDIFPAQQRHYLDKYFLYLHATRFPSFKMDQRKWYIQIFHDFIKDLISTYNEIVAELCSLTADCCPDENLFPWHLLLGEVQEDVVFGPSVFRSNFRQPPIYNNNRLRFEKIRFLHWRMVIQIKNFYIPFVEKPDLAESHYTQIEKNVLPPGLVIAKPKADQIKITPSFALDLPLGQQAIPYYYYVSNDAQSMHLYWSFEAVQSCKTHLLMSYHANQKEGYTNECWVEHPLAYQQNKHSFYRVEGIIGQTTDLTVVDDSDRVLKKFKDLRIRFNLGFKVIRLSYDSFFFDYYEDKNYQINGRISPKVETLMYQGAEHIGGVINGDAYVLLVDTHNQNKIVADFWLPYCCVDQPHYKSINGEVVEIDANLKEANDKLVEPLPETTPDAENTSEKESPEMPEKEESDVYAEPLRGMEVKPKEVLPVENKPIERNEFKPKAQPKKSQPKSQDRNK